MNKRRKKGTGAVGRHSADGRLHAGDRRGIVRNRFFMDQRFGPEDTERKEIQDQ